MLSGEWVVLVRYGEIAVKGGATRSRMERLLAGNIAAALGKRGVKGRVEREQGRIIIRGFRGEGEAVAAAEAASRVMGVVSVSPSLEAGFSDLGVLVEKAEGFFAPRMRGDSFAVDARRTGSQGFTSMDVERELGGRLARITGLKVDLSNPDYVAGIEVRGWKAYFYDRVLRGPGGLPIGSEGKVLSMFSGGIDSPVAAWFMMRRGCMVDMVLFSLGGDEQVRSVLPVARILAEQWSHGYTPTLYVVDPRPLAARIIAEAPEKYVVVLLRRLMMRAASMLAGRIGAKALVTGESLGQVASQTLDNLCVISEASGKPVLRPLIGLDKDEIVKKARIIGTYPYSARVREYCPLGTRRTATRSRLDKIKSIESRTGISMEDIGEILDKAEAHRLS